MILGIRPKIYIKALVKTRKIFAAKIALVNSAIDMMFLLSCIHII